MKLTDMKLTDQVSRHEIDGHENDGHEIDGHEIDGHKIGGQDIYRLKIGYITMQCAILLKNGFTIAFATWNQQPVTFT